MLALGKIIVLATSLGLVIGLTYHHLVPGVNIGIAVGTATGIATALFAKKFFKK